MQIRKLSVLFVLASTLATGTAIAQETDDSAGTDGAQTERQRPDRDQMRQRRENMSEKERAAARERRDSMSDADRQAARNKMRERRGDGGGQRGNGERGSKHPKGERPPKSDGGGV
jgi:hypothetical protein